MILELLVHFGWYKEEIVRNSRFDDVEMNSLASNKPTTWTCILYHS